jgi:hypothetical protein
VIFDLILCDLRLGHNCFSWFFLVGIFSFFFIKHLNKKNPFSFSYLVEECVSALLAREKSFIS